MIQIDKVLVEFCKNKREGSYIVMKINDFLLQQMRLIDGDHIVIAPVPEQPHTSFLFAGDYDPHMAVPTDAVRLYKYSNTWSEKGYSIHIMIHSRMGEDLYRCPDEFQMDRYGNLWGIANFFLEGKFVYMYCGALVPELKERVVERYGNNVTMQTNDHYKVPTRERTEFMKKYCKEIIELEELEGIGFDEPEFWSETGYCKAFRKEWEDYYGSPWQPPHSSVSARYMSERLKAHLFVRHVEEILMEAQKRKPSAIRLVAMHSPIGYYEMGIVAAYHELINLPVVQEMLAEVWNQPFDKSYLEYSSCYNLLRGTGKRLWFFMDPLGDAPDVPLEFYVQRFSENLLSAVMFPQVDSFEVLAWPQRIYGKVTKDYETVINTVVGALSEFWCYQDGKLIAGSDGIGTFVADSMGWQRGDPCKSDFDCFYGISLPLVRKGIPVQVLSLDRVIERDYLKNMKTLLLSYDFLKPMNPEINRRIVEWVQEGGTLVCFGGDDAYNDLPKAWWKQAGFASPLEELFSRMNLSANKKRLDKSLENPIYNNRNGINNGNGSITWEAQVGKGTVIYAGVVSGVLLNSPEGANWICNLTKYAFCKIGESYREQPYFLMQRGPYTAVWVFDKEYTVSGRFINLLSPSLSIVNDMVVPAHTGVFLKKFDYDDDIPRILAVSGRMQAKYEGENVTCFIVRAPSGTNGSARLGTGKREVSCLYAFDSCGKQLPVSCKVEEGNILLSYSNCAEGIMVRVEWKEDK